MGLGGCFVFWIVFGISAWDFGRCFVFKFGIVLWLVYCGFERLSS